MSYKELGAMQAKLRQAQELLSDVYHYACENEFGGLENQLSVADSCIIDSLDMLESLEAQAVDNASWRA
jgi:hypothetical protein